MLRPPHHPRVYLSVSPTFRRLQEQLVRHLAAPSTREDWEITSRRTMPLGADVEAQVLPAIVHADVVVVIATAAYFENRATRAELDLALMRFAAGELHLVVLHAVSCLLDERLPETIVVAPPGFRGRDRESFWRMAAARIAASCEALPSGRPRYEDEENREAGEALRAAWWMVASHAEQSSSAISQHQATMRAQLRLRPGDILGRRFHVRRRIGSSAVDHWEGYDFSGQRAVEIRWIDALDLPSWKPSSEALRKWVALEHPGALQVLTTILEEPGLPGAYFVLERFVGVALREAVLVGTVSGMANIEHLAPVVDYVSALHGMGLVHGGVSLDSIQVGTIKGALTCKLGSGRDVGVADDATSQSTPTMAEDIVSLGRTILACLHGGALPSDGTPIHLRRILQMTDTQPELKALLARTFTAGTARHTDLDRLADLLLGAPLQRAAGSTSWFDLEARPFAGAVTWLGAAPDDVRARPIERPRRRVIIDGFELCIYPVTQRLYKLVMGANPSAHVDECAPAHNIAFRDALEFCNRLSVLRGFRPAYGLNGTDIIWLTEADGYRLPSEAEWECAAQGGERALFPWGSEEPAERPCWNGHGNSLGSHNRKAPSPVWDHPRAATTSGLFDMVGNVWEWCWDRFAPFEEWAVGDDEPLVEPIGPTSSHVPPVAVSVSGGHYRVLRGGAWNIEDPVTLRTTFRSTELEAARDPDIGFRLARGPKPRARHVTLRRSDRAPSGVVTSLVSS